jgi:hypothetical protein
MMKSTLSPTIQKWIDRGTEQKLDCHVRLWVYINSRKVWDPVVPQNKGITERTYDAMFYPVDLSSATPFNNFFIRFYDYSPLFPFRDLKTEAGIRSLCSVSSFSAPTHFTNLIH